MSSGGFKEQLYHQSAVNIAIEQDLLHQLLSFAASAFVSAARKQRVRAGGPSGATLPFVGVVWLLLLQLAGFSTGQCFFLGTTGPDVCC